MSRAIHWLLIQWGGVFGTLVRERFSLNRGFPGMFFFPLRLTVAWPAISLGISIVPEGVQNLRSRQVAFVPISPALIPVPLILCWNTNHSGETRDAFLRLVRSPVATIQKQFVIPEGG